MADTSRIKKMSQLARISRASGDDLFIMVNDPEGTPSTRVITTQNFFNDVGVQAKFYANATFYANTIFESNAIFTGATVDFDSNVSFTSNVSIGSNSTLNLFGVEFTANNPIVSNNYFQQFVANTNQFIRTIQATGEFLLPNGAFAVSNLNFQSYVSNTNLRLANLEYGGTIAREGWANANFVTNTVYQTYKTANDLAVADRMQVANTGALITSRLEPYLEVANALATFSTHVAVQGKVDSGNNTVERLNNVVQTYAANGTNITLQGSSTWRTFPSPVLAYNIRHTTDGKFRITGPGLDPAGEVNPTLYLYKGFTYTFALNETTSNTQVYYPQALIMNYPVTVTGNSTIDTPAMSAAAFANGSVGVASANNLHGEFTVPHSQIANLHYQSTVLDGARGTLVIK